MGRESSKQQRGPKRVRQTPTYVWDDYEGTQWLLGLCLGFAMAGGACRVGLTRDGGAIGIGCYLGDDYSTEYIRPDEDLAQAVRDISQAWGIRIPVWDDEAGRWLVP